MARPGGWARQKPDPGVPRVGLEKDLDQAAMPDSFLAIADLRLAAWFLWITPLETALSSLREASRMSAVAVSRSPPSDASWNLRTAVLSADLTDLLRKRRFSFCLLRLI